MSFANDLWDKFEQVSKVSQDNRKLFEDIIDLFQERTVAEEYYSKTMEKLTIKLQNLQIGKTQGVQNIISSLKTNFMNRSEQAKALCEQIQVEILEKSRQMINDQNNTSKKLISDGKKFEKDLKNASENLEKAKLKFLRLEREAQNSQMQDEILKLSQDVPQEKRLKQTQKSFFSKIKINQIRTKQYLGEVKELDLQYKYHLTEYNNTLDFYYEQMNRIMNNLQDFECQRINQMKDSVMKNIVFETSYIKNIEYDIDNISEESKFKLLLNKIVKYMYEVFILKQKQCLLSKNISLQDLLYQMYLTKKLGQVDSYKDIQEIIDRNNSKKPKQEQLKYEPYISFIGKTIQNLENKNRKPQIEDLIEEYIQYKNIPNPSGEYINEHFPKDIHQATDAIYKQYTEVLQDEIKDKSYFDNVEETLDANQMSRVIWTLCFNFYRMKTNTELTNAQFKNVTQVFVSIMDNVIIYFYQLKLISIFFYQIDEKCYKNKDQINAKKLILLSFSFYTTQESLDYKRLRKHSDEQLQELMDELQKKENKQLNQQQLQQEQSSNSSNQEEQKVMSEDIQKNDDQQQNKNNIINDRKKLSNDEQFEEEKVNIDNIQMSRNKQESKEQDFELEKKNSKNIIVPDGKIDNSQDLSSLSLLEAQNYKEIIQIFKPEVPIKKEKIYVQYNLMNHVIVRSKDFWESCAFESVVSELYTKYRRKQEKKEHFDFTKDKYIIFGQLASVSHNMLIFNFEKREIKDIISRYSRFFSLPEEQLNDLMFTVENHVQKQPVNNLQSENQQMDGSAVNFLKELGSFLKI